MIQNRKIVILLILAFILHASITFAQETIEAIPISSKDSLNLSIDSLIKSSEINKDGLDAQITSSATDTISFDIRKKKMRYRGAAKLDYTKYKLEAEVITIDFENNELTAVGELDTAGIPYGYPIMTEDAEQFAGEKIRFNLLTQKGIISLGETNMDEAFYFGSRIKRMSKKEMFIEDGYYTTCDNPEPHFHFGAHKMKFVAGEKVFVEPVTAYIEDMPLFTIPFGLFFPMESGRKSGIIVPSFYFSGSRGVVFKNFGFYWAASDYWDTQFKGDFFSKGGFMAKNKTQWIIRDVMRGYMDLEYGRTRKNVDDPYNTNWAVKLNHDHTISPMERLTVNLDFRTQGFNRNTYSGNYSNSMEDWTKQSVTSNASFSKSLEVGHSLSASYSRDQNIINNTYSQSSQLSYSVPSFKPLRSVNVLPQWIQDIQTGLRTRLLYNNQKNINYDEYSLLDTTFIDTTFAFDNQSRLELRPSISVSPKLGHFTVTPSIGYSSNVYRRSLTKSYETSDSSLHESYEQGAFYEQNYSFSTGISTKVFGIVDERRPFLFLIKPEMLGFSAFRHTYQPSISMNWRPDQSDNDAYFGEFTNEYGEIQTYSRFEDDGGGLASRQSSFSLKYSDKHVFEIKVPKFLKDKDSTFLKNYELLALNFGVGYNAIADSLKMSDVSLGFRTPAIKFLQFSGTARFTPYDEDIVYKENIYTGEITPTYNKVNRFLMEDGQGLLRMTNMSFSLSTSFSSKGISFDNENDIEEEPDTTETEQKPILGSRFTAKYSEKEQVDYFAENTPGYSYFNLPWNAGMGLTYSYSKPKQDPESLSQSLYLSLNFACTFAETWKVTANTGYDILNKDIRTPTIGLVKDLHCWDLRFNWTPMGDYSGFYLRFGIKVSQLKDLKIEKQDSPLLR